MGTKKYTKTAWVNGSAPAVSATNLLNIENGIEGASGIDVLKNITTGFNNVANGDYSLDACTTGDNNVAIGYNSQTNLTTGFYNTSVGSYSLSKITNSTRNTAIGLNALENLTSGAENVSIGVGSSKALISGYQNVSIGNNSLFTTTASTASVGIGYQSLDSQTTGYLNTAIGHDSLTALTTYYNCTGLGANTAVTGNNQVQLGDAATTTYAYGAVQNRSDERDKADIKNTEIGLEFIKQLRPVDYRWNYREDYKETVTIENEDGTRQKQTITHENDGSKKRTRFHHGLIAQEVKQVADTLGVDFGGYQDHKIAGGEDVLSIGYMELIAPMIKAIQQLNAKIELLESKLGGA